LSARGSGWPSRPEWAKYKKSGVTAAPFIDLHRICDTVRGVADFENRIIPEFRSDNTAWGAIDDRTSPQVFSSTLRARKVRKGAHLNAHVAGFGLTSVLQKKLWLHFYTHATIS
jgi:hypothetical protein